MRLFLFKSCVLSEGRLKKKTVKESIWWFGIDVKRRKKGEVEVKVTECIFKCYINIKQNKIMKTEQYREVVWFFYFN